MDPLRWSSSPSSSGTSSPRTPPCEMLGYVGIEAVLDQLKIKAMKMGFEFNIMVVGECGAGAHKGTDQLMRPHGPGHDYLTSWGLSLLIC